MTLRFLAVVIALLLVAAVPAVRQWRDLRWFDRWADVAGDGRGVWRVLWLLAPAVVLVALIGLLLGMAWWTGLLWLAFSVLVLLHTLGPRYLPADLDALAGAEGPAERRAAAQALRVHADDDAAQALDQAALVEAAVACALKRRFGVVLWFLLLGPAGAVGYRLAQRLGDRADTDERSRDLARRFAQLLDWPAAHLMVFAMALAADFEAVIRAWRAWHQAPAHTPWAFETGFLGAVARAGVRADSVDGEEEDPEPGARRIDLIDTGRLLQRMMLVWLAVVALLMLADWVS